MFFLFILVGVEILTQFFIHRGKFLVFTDEHMIDYVIIMITYLIDIT